MLDVAATLKDGKPALALVNRHPEEEAAVTLTLREDAPATGVLYTINGDSKDSYNDIECPEAVKITCKRVDLTQPVVLEAHSVNVLVCGEE